MIDKYHGSGVLYALISEFVKCQAILVLAPVSPFQIIGWIHIALCKRVYATKIKPEQSLLF
jgi:hypothetical protein